MSKNRHIFPYETPTSVFLQTMGENCFAATLSSPISIDDWGSDDDDLDW